MKIQIIQKESTKDKEMNQERKDINDIEEKSFFKKLENTILNKNKVLNEEDNAEQLKYQNINFLHICSTELVGFGKSTLINALFAEQIERNILNSNLNRSPN